MSFESDLSAYYGKIATIADGFAALAPEYAQLPALEAAVAAHGEVYYVPAIGPDPALLAEALRANLPKSRS